MKNSKQGFGVLVLIIVIALIIIGGILNFNSIKSSIASIMNASAQQEMTGAVVFHPQYTPPHKTSTITISSCQKITRPGNYIISKDLNSTIDSCIAISNINTVDLNCNNHSINATSTGNEGIDIVNVKNFNLYSCNLPSDESMNVASSSNGKIYNNSIGRETLGGIIVSNSNQVVFSNNNFFGQNRVSQSNHIQFNKNNFSGGNPAVELLIQNGNNNSITSNSFDGQSDGIFNHTLGSDDGIVITNENTDTIQDNSMKNFYDAGIENFGFVFNSNIINNRITNAGYTAIGGWYLNSFKSNLIKGNTGDNVGQLFVYGRVYNLLSSEKKVYFKDNIFDNNKLINPRLDGFPLSHGSQISMQSDDPATQAAIEVGNNVFKNNNFTTVLRPVTFTPTSMIVDGGGNICPGTTETPYPLHCLSN